MRSMPWPLTIGIEVAAAAATTATKTAAASTFAQPQPLVNPHLQLETRDLNSPKDALSLFLSPSRSSCAKGLAREKERQPAPPGL